MSISSRRVPSNDASQDKTLNAAGSKGFRGFRLSVHNTSRILGGDLCTYSSVIQ